MTSIIYRLRTFFQSFKYALKEKPEYRQKREEKDSLISEIDALHSEISYAVIKIVIDEIGKINGWEKECGKRQKALMKKVIKSDPSFLAIRLGIKEIKFPSPHNENQEIDSFVGIPKMQDEVSESLNDGQKDQISEGFDSVFDFLSSPNEGNIYSFNEYFDAKRKVLYYQILEYGESTWWLHEKDISDIKETRDILLVAREFIKFFQSKRPQK